MASDNEIDALKAQVNRFKHGVESFNKTGSMNELLSAYIETPKQCLDEHDAKLRMQLDCALKAQVNCLREGLHKLLNVYDCSVTNAMLIADALNTTPEQCIAEVKAKAVEDSMPKIINACVKYSVEKYINTSVEMVSVGQLKHLSEIRHHGEWEKSK